MRLPRATRLAVKIAGRRFWLWRAVDDEGEVLDLLVQPRRDKAAALKLMRKLLKKQGFAPDVLVTDKSSLVRRGKVRNGIVGSARARVAKEQSGREFASTDLTTRAKDAAFQIGRISTTILVCSRRHPKHVQRPAPSHIPPHAPRPPRRGVPDVASRHRGENPNWGFQYWRGQILFA